MLALLAELHGSRVSANHKAIAGLPNLSATVGQHCIRHKSSKRYAAAGHASVGGSATVVHATCAPSVY